MKAATRHPPRHHPAGVAERVRELHSAGLTDAEIAEQMADAVRPGSAGRAQVCWVRRRMGRPANRPARHQQARLRALHAAGLTDSQIHAAMADVFQGENGRRQVKAARSYLGLPANPDVGAGWHKRRQAERELAARWGLPDDLSPQQVAMVMALTGGPMTTEMIFEAVGMGYRTPAGRRAARVTVRGGRKLSYLRDLAERGLVVRGKTDRYGMFTYFLTPHCLESVLAAAQQQLREVGRDDSRRD